MNKNILLLAGALAISGQVQAASYGALVNWQAFEDIGGAPLASGTISAGTYVIGNTLNSGANDTGYKVTFGISAALAAGAALDALLGSAGPGSEWVYTGTEWRGAANATAYGTATNNSGVSQTMDIIEASTLARLGFGTASNPGTALGQAHSVAIGSFNSVTGPDSPVTLAAGDVVTLLANDTFSGLSAWVANNALTVFGRATATNTQSGTGNVDFSVTNRGNFYAEARHNYEKRTTNVPEPAVLGLMGLGFAAMGAMRRRRQS